MQYLNIREEELKNKVAAELFHSFDCTRIIGNVDFCVTLPEKIKNQASIFETESLLWAEAKRGKSDIYKSIVQLILTIGKARTFDKFLPPAFLGAFDAEKIAFVPYNDIHDVFYINDFNWSVAPSNHETKEFKLVLDKVTQTIADNSLLFNFDSDEKDCKAFVKANFILGKSSTSKILIDKNNFMVIYTKWLIAVKPTIAVNWDIAKKGGLIDGDFYLADLLSLENESLKDKLFVLLKKDHYELDRKINEMGMFSSMSATFNDNQKAHTQFWNKYERPPKEEYWEYIVARRDLLVPQDVRERKGSFFTPLKWVELSQRYLTDVLGVDWQDEYYVWDCAAGTGNLLTGLTNKYNIWASTLDRQDVEVMRDRIKNGANLLEEHIFQFDFLNDDFTKLPLPLQNIINDPEKRKKLVIYINPPYAEIAGKKTGVNLNRIHDKYANQLEVANRELFAQFLIRIYNEIPDCVIAEFSKLKTLSASNFKTFRSYFIAKLEKCFVAPADTFDNVSGSFPIGFKIWKTEIKESFEKIEADVYDKAGIYFGKHGFYSFKDEKYISQWVNSFKIKGDKYIGWFEGGTRNSFQHNRIIGILNNKEQISVSRGIAIFDRNLFEVSICFAVRKCIDATWLNDRDQFLYPNDGWKADTEFQNDCLAFALFHGQNRITSSEGTNHWIPFTEKEVNSREKFDSNFMSKFIKGTVANVPSALDVPHLEGVAHLEHTELFQAETRTEPLVFSETAQDVFAAGRELWRYYHAQPASNPNASLYDIREHFQGRNAAGKMNNKSTDAQYSILIATLREKLKALGKKIEPKVYEYGFLMR